MYYSLLKLERVHSVKGDLPSKMEAKFRTFRSPVKFTVVIAKYLNEFY